MARLPVVSGDANAWGDILNTYLLTSINDDGTLKSPVQGDASVSGIGVLSLTTASGNWAFATRRTTDSVVRAGIDGDGAVWWGPGGSVATDTKLYRSAASTLKTDGQFQAGGKISVVGAGDGLSAQSPAGNRFLANQLLGTDSEPAFRVLGDGKIQWSPGGSTTPDTNLYRSASPSVQLATNNHFALFNVGSDANPVIRLTRNGTTSRIDFGAGGASAVGDTNLYRQSVGQLRTDSIFQINNTQLEIQHAAAKIYFGAVGAQDTTLYRQAAGVLKTDGGLQVGVTNLTGGVPKVTISAIGGGPPASPGDGDIWIATGVDAAGARWKFQYNAGSASAYKWEFIGGSDVLAEIPTDETLTTSTGAAVDLATVGPRHVLARAGDYDFIGGAGFWHSAANAYGQLFGWRSAIASFGNGQNTFTPVAGYAQSVTVSGRVIGAAAGDDVRLRYAMTVAGTGHFIGRWIRVRPVRIS
jgi:hypothetical protein